MPHMDEGQLQAWLDHPRSGLPEAEREEIEAHVAACDRCADRLEELRAADAVTRDLVGSMGAAEPAMPDFAEVVERSRSLGARDEASARPAVRRFPVRWAASIVLAVGVGWMANEVARTDPGVVAPPARSAAPVAESSEATPDDGADAPGADREDASPEAGRVTDVAAPSVDPESAAEPGTDPAARSAAEPPADPAPESRVPLASTLSPVAVPPEEIELRRARTAPDVAAVADPTWVTGRVTDVGGRPLGEAVVSIPGTAASALSGPDGRFRMRLPSDSVGPDTRLEATYIGYTSALRDVPTGSGELTVGDLQLEPSALELQGVVVSGTAIDSQRRDVSSTDRVRIEGGEVWVRVARTYAAAVLGTPPLRLPGLQWTEIAVTTIGQTEVVRVTHETPAGDVVHLYQSRTGLEASPAGPGVVPEVDPGEGPVAGTDRATRVTAGGVHLLAVGPIGRDRLAELLELAEEIVDPDGGGPPR